MLALYCIDSAGEEWINDMINRKGQLPIVYFWWHQLPDGGETTLAEMKNQIKTVGFIPIYVKTEKNYYLLTAIDFKDGNPIIKLPNDWREKYELVWPWQLATEGCKDELLKIFEQWKEESWKNHIPRILFSVSSITKLENKPQAIKNWNIYVRLVPLKI